MSKKNHSPGSVPPENRPNAGPGFEPETNEQLPDTSAPIDQEQDPQRRFGGFEGKGEPSIQQPPQRNGGGSHNS